MKLIYRGTTFNYDPANNIHRSIQRRKLPYELIYRGNTYHVNPTVTTKVVKPVECELIYRGSTYQVTRNEQGEVTSVTSSNSSKRKLSTNQSHSKDLVTQKQLLLQKYMQSPFSISWAKLADLISHND